MGFLPSAANNMAIVASVSVIAIRGDAMATAVERSARRSSTNRMTQVLSYGASLRLDQATTTPSPLVGEGRGGGSGGDGTNVPRGSTPTPDPSPQGGGEEFVALLWPKLAPMNPFRLLARCRPRPWLRCRPSAGRVPRGWRQRRRSPPKAGRGKSPRCGRRFPQVRRDPG